MECNNRSCNKPIKDSILCRKCLLTNYCSDECRTVDWNSDHQNQCTFKKYSLKDFIPVNKGKNLGKGAYGEVQLVKHIKTKHLYALKVIRKKNLHRSNSLKMMYREISVQKKLNHANIIRLYGHIEDIDCIYLILEYAAKGNLFHYIRDRKRLTEEETWPFFTRLFCIDFSSKKFFEFFGDSL